MDWVRLDTYTAGSALTSAITLTSCPVVIIPGFDQYFRPVGLQIVAAARGETAALAVTRVFDQVADLDGLLPVDPRSGVALP